MNTDNATTKPDGGASASTAELGGFSDLAKALSGVIEMEVLIQQLVALGVEYQTGNLLPARFAARTHELLVAYQRDEAKTPNAELSGPRPLAAEGSDSNDVLGAVRPRKD